MDANCSTGYQNLETAIKAVTETIEKNFDVESANETSVGNAKGVVFKTSLQNDQDSKQLMMIEVLFSGEDIYSVYIGIPDDYRDELEPIVTHALDSIAIKDAASPVFKEDVKKREQATKEKATSAPEQSQPVPDKPKPQTTTSLRSSETLSQKNAVEEAKSYLDYSSFSYSGLVHQLEFEGFSTADATWGADNCGADWYEQAVDKAKSYLDYTSFSYTGLIDQLEFEGFTTDQATYGTDNCGADWYEQAYQKALEYLDYSSFSHDGLVDQLIFEGFTADQAEHGVNMTGL
jgi:hypothetical protein